MNFIKKTLFILIAFLTLQTNFILPFWFLQDLGKALTLDDISLGEQQQVSSSVITQEQQSNSKESNLASLQESSTIQTELSQDQQPSEDSQSVKSSNLKYLNDLHSKILNSLGKDPSSNKSNISNIYQHLLSYYISLGRTFLSPVDIEKILVNLKLNNPNVDEEKINSLYKGLKDRFQGDESLISIEPISMKDFNGSKLVKSNSTSNIEKTGYIGPVGIESSQYKTEESSPKQESTELLPEEVIEISSAQQEVAEFDAKEIIEESNSQQDTATIRSEKSEEIDEQLEADLNLAKYLEQIGEDYLI